MVSSDGWNHGVIGIVASKLVEKYKKPVFIIGERGEEATGSARSFGDFSAADAVRAADDIIIKGGGHGAAAGVTLATEKIGDFRRRVNGFYDSLQLTNQERYLLPRADVEIDDFSEINEELVENLAKMEPFGNGNPEPVLKITTASVLSMRRMGADGQHVKLALRDKNGKVLQMLAFNAPEEFFREPGDEVAAWFQPRPPRPGDPTAPAGGLPGAPQPASVDDPGRGPVPVLGDHPGSGQTKGRDEGQAHEERRDPEGVAEGPGGLGQALGEVGAAQLPGDGRPAEVGGGQQEGQGHGDDGDADGAEDLLADVEQGGGIADLTRSEERRVGKECRSRWSPYH